MDDPQMNIALGEMRKLRETGNVFFKEKQFEEATQAYEEALDLLHRENLAAERELTTALRLNLAFCLGRLGREWERAVELCDEVLIQEPENSKALFRRGQSRHLWSLELAKAEPATSDVLRALRQNARKDLMRVAKLEPADRQVRAYLQEVTEALNDLPHASASSSGGDKLRGAFNGLSSSSLYEDRKPAPPPAPPVYCSTCKLYGHAQCGKAWWLQQRAQWLGIDVEAVAKEPPDFEDNGCLLEKIRTVRRAAGSSMPVADLHSGHKSHCPDEELSDSEREELEDCLESTEKPYPQPRRRLPLVLTVHVAEELWAECCK